MNFYRHKKPLHFDGLIFKLKSKYLSEGVMSLRLLIRNPLFLYYFIIFME